MRSEAGVWFPPRDSSASRSAGDVDTPGPRWISTACYRCAAGWQIATIATPSRYLSVVVPVLERSRALGELLQALAAQSLAKDSFEVVVCDDGSSVAEAATIEAHVMRAGAEHGLSTVYLRQRRAGAGAARNLGLAKARGSVVAFTDSDCLPDSAWLARLSAAFDDEQVGLAGGSAEYRGAAQLAGRCVNFLMMTTLGAGGARDPRASLHVKFYPRSYNLAVRRELALTVGGFPRALYGEDIEFSQRVAARGAGIAFVPDAVVVHDERRTPWGTAVQSFAKGYNRVETARRCGMHNVLYAAPAALVAFCVAATALAVLGSPVTALAGLPLAIYGAAIGGLGVYGGFAMREAIAVPLLPCYSILMHAAYGLGYWWALLELVGECPRRCMGVPSARPAAKSVSSQDRSHREAYAAHSPAPLTNEEGG